MQPDTDSPPATDGTRFVLLHTSHPGNVGSTARAMRVMGFSDLVLVAPRYPNVKNKADAIALASGALDVLSNARIVDTLAEALDGITYACATAMTPRDFGPPTHAPRDLFPALVPQRHRVAFIFGSERYGMTNDDVYRCHACLSIPTAPGYGSLNLAQAVQLIAYDWRQALGGFAVNARGANPALADAQSVQGALDHWQSVLVNNGFLNLRAPQKLIPRLQQLFNRAQLTNEEVQILRGMARACSRDVPE